MGDKKRTATVVETEDSLYSVEINVSGHKIIGDEPESFGSANLGPSPYDFLLASLGECTAMTVRWYAIQQKWPLENVKVELTHEKQAKQDHFTKTIEVIGDELTAEQKEKLHDVAAKCPVHRTLQSDIIIETLS